MRGREGVKGTRKQRVSPLMDEMGKGVASHACSLPRAPWHLQPAPEPVSQHLPEAHHSPSLNTCAPCLPAGPPGASAARSGAQPSVHAGISPHPGCTRRLHTGQQQGAGLPPSFPFPKARLSSETRATSLHEPLPSIPTSPGRLCPLSQGVLTLARGSGDLNCCSCTPVNQTLPCLPRCPPRSRPRWDCCPLPRRSPNPLTPPGSRAAPAATYRGGTGCGCWWARSARR